MKPFTKRLALVTGLLFTALICMGIVYIDNTKHFLQTVGGITQMFVNTNYVFGVDTNTGRVGFGVTNTTSSFAVVGKKPGTNALGNGTTAAITGRIDLTGGQGGDTFAPTSATGGVGGGVQLLGGDGGGAPLATTNNTGGTGGSFVLTAGNGGGATGVATNATTGGNGGTASFGSGAGGIPSTASTNTIGGNGGAVNLIASDGGTPTDGWSRKGGGGGSVNITAGTGGASQRTNATALAGAINITAGGAGAATIAPGNPVPGGLVNITGGAGSTGPTTNSDGGHVFIAGGAPGAGAVPGNVVLARTSGGTSRGAGVQIGPAVGGIATITNVLGGAASLDFGSVAAGSFEDQPITVTGATSNNVAVCLSVPWMCATNGGAFVTYNSNDTIYVRFLNNQLVTAIDPPQGTFTVVGFRIR